MNVPNWLWFVIAIILVLVLLLLLGWRVKVTSAVVDPSLNYWWLITHPRDYYFSWLETV